MPQFTVVPALSDFDAHIKRYKELIEKPNSQCARMRKHMQDVGNELVLYDVIEFRHVKSITFS